MSTLNTYEFHLNGYRYALWPQWSNGITHWKPYRQRLIDGYVESKWRSFATEGEAYILLVIIGMRDYTPENNGEWNGSEVHSVRKSRSF